MFTEVLTGLRIKEGGTYIPLVFILPMNLKLRPLIINNLRMLRFMGSMREKTISWRSNLNPNHPCLLWSSGPVVSTGQWSLSHPCSPILGRRDGFGTVGRRPTSASYKRKEFAVSAARFGFQVRSPAFKRAKLSTPKRSVTPVDTAQRLRLGGPAIIHQSTNPLIQQSVRPSDLLGLPIAPGTAITHSR